MRKYLWYFTYTPAAVNASMGPQLYRCGNEPYLAAYTSGNRSLQWGRNFIVAEIFKHSLTVSLTLRLQWGRNFIVAEMLKNALRFFTWASLQWGRNFIVAEMPQPLQGCSHTPSFNGAATLSLRKSVPDSVHDDRGGPASMGPQLYRCGNETWRPTSIRQCISFNGAATLSLRK